MGSKNIPHESIEVLGPYYVYALLDPSNEEIFYVGKGSGNRATSHLKRRVLEADPGSQKSKRIESIRRVTGREPVIDIIRRGIRTSDEAFQIESALIDCLPGLSNQQLGHGVELGRERLDSIIERSQAPLLQDDMAPPAILIRLGDNWVPSRERLEKGYFRAGHGWREGILDEELYDSVRAWWRFSPKEAERRGVKYAVAVHRGITKAIYRIDNFIGPTYINGLPRFGFQGSEVRTGKFFNFYVGHHGKRVPFKNSAQNSVRYWPPA